MQDNIPIFGGGLERATQPTNSKGHNFSTIQAAIDDMGTDAGWIYVPPGTYIEAVDIVGKNNIMLFGAGWGMTKITYAGNGDTLNIDNSDDVIIRDIRIDLTHEGSENSVIRIDDAPRCKIHNVYIGVGEYWGIEFRDAVSSYCEISNCYLTEVVSIVIYDAGSNLSTGLKILGNTLVSNGGRPIYLNSDNITITNNYINGFGASSEGIFLGTSSDSCIVSNNRIIDNTAWTTSHEPINDDGDNTVENNNCCVDGGEPAAYNSKGCIFDTVQLAITLQNGSGEVHVLPGTHTEAVTISVSNMTIIGAGSEVTTIGTSTGHALNITGNYVTIKEMSLQTTSSAQNYDCINATGTHLVATNVTFKDSDRYGLYINTGDYARISLCHFVSTSIDDEDIYLDDDTANDTIMTNTFVTMDIQVDGDRISIMGNTSENAGDVALATTSTDAVVVGNVNISVTDAGATTPELGHNS